MCHENIWFDKPIQPGETRNVSLAISQSYSARDVVIPIRVIRAKEPGPTVFVTAALHGDEINGTGAIRQIIQDDSFRLTSGTLLLVPVLNLLAFDRHSRYLPDRRDLNRCFPGSPTGSLAARMAWNIFQAIVERCDYGIDLHTASVRRTNYPNVRGDMKDKKIKRMVDAFGCEININSVGPAKSLRREASRAGCPTIVMEGGEVWKVEPGVVENAVRGVKNVLRDLKMLDGELESPNYQISVEKTKWIRAEKGGFLQFHVSPGDLVDKNQPLATNLTLLGREQSVISSPFDAVVIGMTTLPATSPGEPICNLGKLPKGVKPKSMRRERTLEDGLEGRLVDELSSNVMVVDKQ